MKPYDLFVSTFAIGCVSLSLVNQNARAVAIDNNRSLQQSEQMSQLLAQTTQPTSQDQILNTINSLTPTQQQQITSIFQSSQPAIDQKTDQLQTALTALEQSLTPNTPASTISAAHQKVISIAQQRNQLYFNRLLKIREVLTVQQRSQLNPAVRELNSSSQPDSEQIDVLISTTTSLTPAQQQQITQIVNSAQPAIDQKTQQLQAALQSFNRSLQPNTPASAISTAHDRVITTAIQRNQLYFNRLLKIREVLTVEQRTQINQAISSLVSL